jgi:hypothetical protein
VVWAAGRPKIAAMVVLAAHVWTFWISALLVLSAIGLIAGIGVMYVKKVVAPRYPKD